MTWNQDYNTTPTFKVSDAVTAMEADKRITVNLNDINAEDGKDVYIYVFAVNETKTHKAPKALRFTLKSSSRPADTTASTTPTRDPIIPRVSESKVTGLENALEFYPNTFYKFSVTGAGTEPGAKQMTSPVEGDVQWRPCYWSTSSNPSPSQRNNTWQIGAKNGIKDAATFNMYVFFEKWRYSGTEWQKTDTVESATYQFKSKSISFNATVTPSPTGSGGYDSYYDTDGEGEDSGYGTDPAYREDDGTDTGASSEAENAQTGDNSPVGTMGTLAALSLLAGGYVLVRRRKRETE